jgi:hypothetical protein
LQFQALGLRSYRCDLGAYIDVQPRLRSAYANPVTGTWAIVTSLSIAYNKSFPPLSVLDGSSPMSNPGAAGRMPTMRIAVAGVRN